MDKGRIVDTGLREMARRRLHHRGRGFITPWDPGGLRGLKEVVKWKLGNRNPFKPFYKEEPMVPVAVDWQALSAHEGLSVTFITHATLLIKDLGAWILIDPVLSGLFWPIRNHTPLAFDPSAIPAPDYILITHGHYDHLDRSSLRRTALGSRIITPLGYRKVIGNVGAAEIRELDWFDAVADGPREIILLPCSHWTRRGILANTELWGSFLIKTAAGPVIYVAGDTAYFDGFADIGREFDIDLAIFNLGAYEPRWFMKTAHINPPETVRAFQELRARRLMVVHWGTFRLGDEPVHFPPRDIRAAMAKAALEDRLVDIRHGQTRCWSREGKVGGNWLPLQVSAAPDVRV